MLVCIPCRDANPSMKFTEDATIHQACGERLTLSPRKWSPPKRNNKRAWKRIANGEWLWDRRRVRRNPPPAMYYRESWIRPMNYKKGQGKVFQDNVPTSRGPRVDLGG